MVARSATCNLGRQSIQQLGVTPGIDLTLQQARGTRHRESAHFLPQALARSRGFTRHLILRLRQQALRFARGRSLGFLDDFIRALARLLDDLRRAITRFADDLLGARLGLVEVLFAFARSSQTVGYFL